MMRRAWLASAGLVAAAACLPAQPAGGPVMGPVMGYVAERGSNRLRPVLGIPGAAVLGESFEPAGEISVVQASPLGDYVVVTAGPNRESALWLPQGELRQLPEVARGGRLAALSPSGSSAIFFDAAARRLEIVAGLPGEPVLLGELDATGMQAPYAVSDDGQIVLGGAEGAAVVCGLAGERSRIVLSAAPAAMAFAAGTHDALVAFGSEAAWIRRVEQPAGRVRLTAGPLAAAQVAAERPRSLRRLAPQESASAEVSGKAVNSIAAAAVSIDRRTAVLADRSGEIVVFDLASGAQRFAANCHCSPEGLFRMNESSALRITGASGRSLLLIDISSEPPRILTVNPAADPEPKP